jgi:hypothetical protein
MITMKKDQYDYMKELDQARETMCEAIKEARAELKRAKRRGDVAGAAAQAVVLNAYAKRMHQEIDRLLFADEFTKAIKTAKAAQREIKKQ